MLNYVFYKNDILTEASSLLELSFHFKIKISNIGVVTINGKEDTISYNMDIYTLAEAYLDFINNRLPQLCDIYKVIKL